MRIRSILHELREAKDARRVMRHLRLGGWFAGLLALGALGLLVSIPISNVENAASASASYYYGTTSTATTTIVTTTTVAAPTPVAPPQENNTFLCYSKLEQDSGLVVNVKLVDQFRAGGYWLPYAVEGKAPSDAYTTAGGFYLVCNPPSTLKLTFFGVDLDGFAYPLPLYSFDPTVFPIVA
jgi:hypothetical protein